MHEMFNIDKNSIAQICVPIIIAVLSLSYPIILDKISNISDKYNSISILDFFENEFFQKKYSQFFLNERWTISRIEIIFCGTLLSLVLLFLDYDLLLFRWIIFIMTIILIVSFYMWFDKVITYNNGDYSYILQKNTEILKER